MTSYPPPQPRELRFGAVDGALFSEYWKVRASPRRPEFVMAGSRTGQFLHVTMHENDAFWHMKVKLPDGVITRQWEPPRDVLPGVRRMVRLLIPFAAVRLGKPSRASRVQWYPGPPDEQTWVEFTVLHARAGLPQVSGADVLGVVPLADGTEDLVIARQAPVGPVEGKIPVDDDVAQRLREGKELGALLGGVDDDGCLWFLSLFSSPRPVPDADR